MKLSDKLSELYCGITGHEMIVEDSRLRCMHCPKESESFNMFQVPLSASERTDIYEFMMEQEYQLIGGG